MNVMASEHAALGPLPQWLEPSLSALLALRQKLPHALLLLGPGGVGKSSLAIQLAGALLCESSQHNQRACGSCPACGWFAQANHPDFRLLAPGSDDDPAKDATSTDIKIGQIRRLSDFLSIGAHRGGRKIVLIDPADAMNLPAANALLKTLEEPPGNTVFILVSNRPDGLPATIRSRCVTHKLALPTSQEACAWLCEHTGVTLEHAKALLAAAAGSPFRAAVLAQPEQAAAYRLIVANFAKLPHASVLATAEALAQVAPRFWVPLLQGWVGDMARVRAGSRPSRFPDQAKRLETLANEASLDAMVEFSGWLGEQSLALQHPLNPRLFCENMLLRYQALFV